MKALRELHARVKAGIGSAEDLSAKRRKDYEKATKRVLSQMGGEALRRLHANVKEFRYYRDHDGLHAGVLTKYPPLVRRIKPRTRIRGMFDVDGAVHLNGGGVMFTGMPKRSIEAFHAHQLAHGIDGTDHDVSSTPAWNEIWLSEIVGNAEFSKKGQTVASEAFAEAGAYLLDNESPRRIFVKRIPRTLQFWETNNLLATGGT